MTCKHCGKEFKDGRIRKYCSLKCRQRVACPMPILNKRCECCGKKYETTSKRRIYCSLVCRKKAVSKKCRVNPNGYMRGDKFKEHRRMYEKERSRKDVMFVIKRRMRSRMFQALRRGKDGQSWQALVGYSVHDLKTHIEKRFIKGMTWQRFLAGEIHIDHKIPVSAFNFTTENDIDFKRCWAISNLQPLWAKDNLSKNDKIFYPFQPSLGLAVSM